MWFEDEESMFIATGDPSLPAHRSGWQIIFMSSWVYEESALAKLQDPSLPVHRSGW